MLGRRRCAQPRLETLEGRVTPAGTFTWVGGDVTKPTDFYTKANWAYMGADMHDYPGQMNRNDDKIVFDNNASANCEATLTGDLSVLSLQLKSNFTKAFTLTGTKGVIVRAQGVEKADFELAGGTLTLKGSTFLSLEKIALDGMNPKAIWSGGDLSTGGDATARAYLFDTTQLVKENGGKLGATLVIGESKAGTPGGSTVYLADGNIGARMSGHLKLYKNAAIQVKSLGMLVFGQDVNTDTKGGIDVDGAASTSKIDNEGTIIRPYKDMNVNNYILVKPRVTNKADGARVILEKDTRVNFEGGADLLKGEYTARAGAKTKGVIRMMGGSIRLDGGGLAPDTYAVSFLDGLELLGGELVVDSAPGAFFNIEVGGDLTLGPTALVRLNANGAAPGQCDTFSVAGQTAVEGATLVVNTQGAAPPVGATYDFLQSAGGAIGPGWAGLVAEGIPADYVFEALGRVRAV